MLRPSVVEEIRRLLAAGRLSYRQIAKATGASRGSVGAIASGRRREYPRPDETWPDTGPPGRCPTCGAKVYLPCRSCLLPRVKASPPMPEEAGIGMDLELTEIHRTRYEQVRLRRATGPRAIEQEPFV